MSALATLKRDYEVVASASGSFFLIGEYSVLRGQTAIVMPIPLRTHVALRLEDDLNIREIVSEFPKPEYNYRELRTGKKVNQHVLYDTGKVERVKDSLTEFLDEVLDDRFGFSIKVRSDIPPSCGLNSSGAFSAALSACANLITNRVSHVGMKTWKDRSLPSLLRDKEFGRVFRLAIRFEQDIHKYTSGCGPFVSLVGAPDQLPVVYSIPSLRKVEPADTVERVSTGARSIRLSSLISLPSKQGVDHHTRLVSNNLWGKFALAYSGMQRMRGPNVSIPDVAEIEERLAEGVERLSDILHDSRIPQSDLPSSLTDLVRANSKQYGSRRLWNTFGSLAITMMKNIIEWHDEDLTDVIEITEGLLSYLRKVPENIENASAGLRVEGITSKITGAGNGGDLVLFSPEGNTQALLKQACRVHKLQLVEHLSLQSIAQNERSVPPVQAVAGKKIIRTKDLDWRKKPAPGIVRVTVIPINLGITDAAVDEAGRGKKKAEIIEALTESQSEGPQLYILPELSISGAILHEVQKTLGTLVDSDLKVVVGGSFYELERTGLRFNRSPIITKRSISYQDKILRSPKEESRKIAEASQLSVFKNTPVGNFAVAICSSVVVMPDVVRRWTSRSSELLDFVLVPSLNKSRRLFVREAIKLTDTYTHVVIANTAAVGGSAVRAPMYGKRAWKLAPLRKGITKPQSVDVNLHDFHDHSHGYRTPL